MASAVSKFQMSARPRRRERFLRNVLWSWTGVAVSIVTGLLLSPYIIRKLGNEAYGVWSLVFSFIEYYWLLDLGMRSATMKYSAHYRATGEDDKVNEVINTGVAYSSGAAVILIAATLALAGHVTRFFQISDSYRPAFTSLITIVGIAWAAGTVFSLLSGVVEGYQRFDLTSRVWISTMALRTGGLVIALAMGFGLKAMALVSVASLAAGYAYNYRNVRQVFPGVRFSLSAVRAPMLRQMLGYGVHTSLANIAQQMLLNQAAPVLIGHFMPTAFVGYFALPVRLLRYSVDLVCRVGFVTGSNAAEMAARGEHEAVYRMGVYVNRYCYAMFAPLAIALTVYGAELLRVWINPEFALQSGPILPVIAISTTLAVAAQFNSSSILYGLAKHQRYGASLMVEAILTCVGLYVAIPRYGLAGAAWVTSVLMVVNRGLFASWLFCQGVERGFGAYLRDVYLWPTVAAVPVLAGAWSIKTRWLPGRDWFEVLAGMAILGAAYYGAAFFLCLEKEHRAIPWRWIRGRLAPSPAE